MPRRGCVQTNRLSCAQAEDACCCSFWSLAAGCSEISLARLQVDGWSWLAEGLPHLHTLVLRRVIEGVDGVWPAALAKCTGLQTLTLEGRSTAPLPDGPYLERLRTLDWLCDPDAAVLDALTAATALERLRLTVAPERMAASSVLDSLPNLRHVEFVASNSSEDRDESEHIDALAELRRRLRAEVSYR